MLARLAAYRDHRVVGQQVEDDHLGDALLREAPHQGEQRLRQRGRLRLIQPRLVEVESHRQRPVGAQVAEAAELHDILDDAGGRLVHLLLGGLRLELQRGEPLQQEDQFGVALAVLTQQVVPGDGVLGLGLCLVVLFLQRCDLADSRWHRVHLQPKRKCRPREHSLLLQQRQERVVLVFRLLGGLPVGGSLRGGETNEPEHIRQEPL
mmetsp:Transcript_67599/g.174120  ORF Transcript_67599/g.174120 Transcript_67599/m.174120 type:complete len:207 (-) Transcript_67599:321-941(-)